MREPVTQSCCQCGTEINVCDGVVKDEITHRSGNFDLSVEHDVCAIDDVESLLDVVIADDNANAPMPKAGNDGLNVMNSNWINTREGLVEHHETRFCYQCACDLETPSFAAGKSV